AVDRKRSRKHELAISGARAPPGKKEGPGSVELLNAVIFPVCDVDVAAAINGNADRVVELTVPGAGDCATTARGARASETDASVIDGFAVDVAVAATQTADVGAEVCKLLNPLI